MPSLIGLPLSTAMHRVSVFAGYASALAGLTYYSLQRLALDTSKTDDRLAEVPRTLAGGPFMWAGLVCLALGLLSILLFALVKAFGQSESPRRVGPVFFLSWIPGLWLLGTLIMEWWPKDR